MKIISVLMLSLFLVVGWVTPLEAQAKKLGSGGMKRSVPTQSAPKPAPAKETPEAAKSPASPTQAAGRSSWMGPIAGLAAGLGLAALASHLGFGEELANGLMIALLAVVAVSLLTYIMRRRQNAAAPTARSAWVPAPDAGAHHRQGGRLPVSFPSSEPPARAQSAPDSVFQASVDEFDDSAFLGIAKQIFIRMQATNDAADLADLRKFTTPEMYASIQAEWLHRIPGLQQHTEVIELSAQLADRAVEDEQQVVTVRFTGSVREYAGGPATPINEWWHFVRPLNGSRSWAIGGIQLVD